MKVTVDVTGGQGFMPDEVKTKNGRLNPKRVKAFAQDIIDRYCNSEYFDIEAVDDNGNPRFPFKDTE